MTNLAQVRLALVAGLPQLLITDAVLEFADELHAQPGLTDVPEQDAVHVAVWKPNTMKEQRHYRDGTARVVG
jgi:hypothetical protein